MSNSEFNPVVNGSTESVDIPIKKIYEILGVDKKYFYHDNLRIWLNARIGIRVNDVLALLYDTLEGQCLIEKGMSYLEKGFYMPIDMNSEGINAPLNSDGNGKGIKNALYARYGIDWTEITNKNFESHFGINKDLKAVYAYDGYKIKCINKSTNSIISETDTIDGDTDGYVPITPADKIDELYYTGEYKIDKYVNSVLDKSNTAKGKSISLYINKGKSPVVYEISFYYDKSLPPPDEPDDPYIPPDEPEPITPFDKCIVKCFDKKNNTFISEEEYTCNATENIILNKKNLPSFNYLGFYYEVKDSNGHTVNSDGSINNLVKDNSKSISIEQNDYTHTLVFCYNPIIRINPYPTAMFTYTSMYNDAIELANDTCYVGYNTKLNNLAYGEDENDNFDLKTIMYNFKDLQTGQDLGYITLNVQDKSNEIYQFCAKNLPSESLEIIKWDNKGNIYFKANKKMTIDVKQTATDEIGQSDYYSDIINVIECDLKPVAILTDTDTYRYPTGAILCGKQNRVVELSLSESKVNTLFYGKTSIDHTKDYVEIIALEGQNINSIKLPITLGAEYLSDKIIIKRSFTAEKMLFKESGKYQINAIVTDMLGNVSEKSINEFTVHEDTKPLVIGINENKVFRNNDKIATLLVKDIIAYSNDGDNVKINSVYYKYDSNNDGSFDNEVAVNLTLKNNAVSFTTQNLGKYIIVVNVKDSFGQATLSEFITDIDYMTNAESFSIEVDNQKPVITNFIIRGE